MPSTSFNNNFHPRRSHKDQIRKSNIKNKYMMIWYHLKDGIKKVKIKPKIKKKLYSKI